MKNQSIGALGEAFIQKQIELGIGFEDAWDEWEQMEGKLRFVLIDCPEVTLYDDRRVVDAQERLRIRELAKARLGNHVRSIDVTELARAATALGVEMPLRRYHMDRSVLTNWISTGAESIEEEEGYSSRTQRWRQAEMSEEVINTMAEKMESFAEAHGLWAVPPNELIPLYFRHKQRLSAVTVHCECCGEKVIFPVESSEGTFQQLVEDCTHCRTSNRLQIWIENGEPNVMEHAVLESEATDKPKGFEQ